MANSSHEPHRSGQPLPMGVFCSPEEPVKPDSFADEHPEQSLRASHRNTPRLSPVLSTHKAPISPVSPLLNEPHAHFSNRHLSPPHFPPKQVDPELFPASSYHSRSGPYRPHHEGPPESAPLGAFPHSGPALSPGWPRHHDLVARESQVPEPHAAQVNISRAPDTPALERREPNVNLAAGPNAGQNFRSCVVIKANANLIGWFKRNLEELETRQAAKRLLLLLMKSEEEEGEEQDAQVTKEKERTKATKKRKAAADEDGEIEDSATKRKRLQRATFPKPNIPRRATRHGPSEAPLDAPLDDLEIPSVDSRSGPAASQPSDASRPAAAPVKHKRKASRTTSDNGRPVPKAHMDFRLVPDYCPPISTLSPKTNMRTDWTASPHDLTNDPHRDLLEEVELQLASTLRLPCAKYLFAKKSIFEKYVELLRAGNGHGFNKTHAQNVCHIDVNKASRLFLVFERVGWFDRKHFVDYL